MDIFALSSTVPYSQTPLRPPLSATCLAGKRYPASIPSVSASKSSPEPNPDDSSSSSTLRRPTSHKPLKTSTSGYSKSPRNPLKSRITSQPSSSVTPPPSHTLSSKLWLSSKLSPPPPPPLPPPPLAPEEILSSESENLPDSSDDDETYVPRNEFLEKGKIFVGNLPLWIKKNEVAEYFRQFGPIKNVILIKGYDDTERNLGFGFVIYGGPTAENSAMKAVEFDGVEFRGRVLTVKLDDGRRLKGMTEQRVRWVEGKEGVDYRSKWHEEREGSRKEFRKVLETQPENWQAVVRAFERVKKVVCLFRFLC